MVLQGDTPQMVTSPQLTSAIYRKWRNPHSKGPIRLRLFEFVQISDFFSIYITDICQTSESFAKTVNLKKERAKRTIPSIGATGVMR